MEILLQGKEIYGLKEWGGAVEVSPLRLFQMKRVFSSRSAPVIFRKLFKIFKGPQSPLKLPAELLLDDLDFGDFTQVMIALIALSGGRTYQKTYTCPNKKCKALNPRVIDIIQVFTPKEPKILGGALKIPLQEITVEGQIIPELTCGNITIGNFLKAYELSEKLTAEEARELYPDLTIDLEDDAEDFNQFVEVLADFMTLALSIDVPGKTTTEEKVRWLANLQGDDTKLYAKISQAIQDLTVTVESLYKTTCTKCKADIIEVLEATDYFFGSR